MPDLLFKLLNTLFRIVLFTDCGSQWSLSKPILSLKLADPIAFERLKKNYLDTKAIHPEAQKAMKIAFEDLTHEIRENLEQGNRDRFSRHVSTFRKTILPLLKR